MNLRQASLCLDCDELLDSEMSHCPHCSSTYVHPLVKFIKPMPAIKVIEITGKIARSAPKGADAAPKAVRRKIKKPATPGNGRNKQSVIPAPVRYIGTLQQHCSNTQQ